MDGSLSSAVKRAARRRAQHSGAASLAVFGALMAYVWAVVHSTLYIIVNWQFPSSSPHSFPGVADLGASLTVANALWAALLVAILVKVLRGPRHFWRSRVVPLLAALTLVAMMQQLASLVLEVAHW